MDIKKINEVITIIKKNKYKAYLVGGSSRDFIFSRDFTDIDIATNAPIDFLTKTFKVESEEGKSMGSIKINYKNLIMEITRFRKEKYDIKSIYPKVEKFINDEEEDACRRDFTINAIYLDTTNFNVVDPFDGVKDLFSFVVRFIGEPNVRIKEDPTRIIRGIRLAYKMNFTIDEKTNQAFIDNVDELKRVSKNKLEKEIEKMIVDFGEERTNKILSMYNISMKGDLLLRKSRKK